MSVVVYRDGVMAADTRAWSGHGGVPMGRKIKIERLDDGTLIGATSADVGANEALRKWYKEGADPDLDIGCKDGFSFIAVAPDGKAMIAIGTLKLSGPIEGEYFAIGSGCEFALGAMLHGASAVEAVETACTLSMTCALPATVLTHDPAK
jgi:hypothetical protein